MANIVPVQPGALTGVLSSLSSLTIQPFAQEIYLTHFEVAGLRYSENIEEHLKLLKKGDQLRLCREPKNEYDTFAILVQDQEKHKLGYMPRRMNHIPARLLDAGKLLYAKVTDVDPDDYDYLRLGVNLFMQG